MPPPRPTARGCRGRPPEAPGHPQPAQRHDPVLEGVARAGDHLTAHHHEIGRRRVGQGDGTPDGRAGHAVPAVESAAVGDAETIQMGGESGHGHVDGDEAIAPPSRRGPRRRRQPGKPARPLGGIAEGGTPSRVEQTSPCRDAATSGRSTWTCRPLTDQTLPIFGDHAIVRHPVTAETARDGQTNPITSGVLMVWHTPNGDGPLLARPAVRRDERRTHGGTTP